VVHFKRLRGNVKGQYRRGIGWKQETKESVGGITDGIYDRVLSS
jgi:hypothetical protein